MKRNHALKFCYDIIFVLIIYITMQVFHAFCTTGLNFTKLIDNDRYITDWKNAWNYAIFLAYVRVIFYLSAEDNWFLISYWSMI